MKYFRLNYISDNVRRFALVFPPSLADYHLINAYHEEFRADLSVFTPNYWIDEFCYSRFKAHYDQLLVLLKVDCRSSELMPDDRHRFFVSAGVVGASAKLSYLQRLLGYEEVTGGEESGVVDTQRIDLRLIAAMQTLGWQNIDWIAESFGAEGVQEMITSHLAQISGKDEVSEEQRQKDRAKVERLKSQNTIIERNKQKAMADLMLRTGVAAVNVNRLKREADGRQSGQNGGD